MLFNKAFDNVKQTAALCCRLITWQRWRTWRCRRM